MAYTPMEELEFFKQYVSVADWAWRAVARWAPLAQETVGKQLIRACDSVGANLFEGDGRGTVPDAALLCYRSRVLTPQCSRPTSTSRSPKHPNTARPQSQCLTPNP
jgi:hypothetical protein